VHAAESCHHCTASGRASASRLSGGAEPCAGPRSMKLWRR
jgi:hypothetical protein